MSAAGPDPQVVLLAEALVARGWRAATCESCTGGGVAAALTALPGSSVWFVGGFVTYADALKSLLVDVPAETLGAHGAVSEATALAMATGTLRRTGADLAVAVTGIAGPGGGSAAKPVGTVWFAWALRGGEACARVRCFPGDRAAVREASVREAIEGLLASARAGCATAPQG